MFCRGREMVAGSTRMTLDSLAGLRCAPNSCRDVRLLTPESWRTDPQSRSAEAQTLAQLALNSGSGAGLTNQPVRSSLDWNANTYGIRALKSCQACDS
jgi:hypothetical protein